MTVHPPCRDGRGTRLVSTGCSSATLPPSIVRFPANEVGEKYPRTRPSFETLLAKAVELTEDQQRAVVAAETAPKLRIEKSGGLPVMA